MKAGELREVMAQAMLISPEICWRTWRNLRESKDGSLVSSGARGVNAPDVTYLDAARVLICHILDSNPGRRAPEYVRKNGPIPRVPNFEWEGEPFTLEELQPDMPVNSLEEGIAALIAVFTECRTTDAYRNAGRRTPAGGFQKPLCRIEIFPEECAATITMGDESSDLRSAQYSFEAPPPNVGTWNRNRHDERFRLGRQEIAFVNQEVIAMIADGFIAAEAE